MDQLRIVSYEETYPMPSLLKDHIESNPKSFNIQVLGVRGAGKSSFINRLLKLLQIDYHKAKTGCEETTLKTEFFDISEACVLPEGFKKVYLVDQPGIGGYKIREAKYLQNYGPGEKLF